MLFSPSQMQPLSSQSSHPATAAPVGAVPEQANTISNTTSDTVTDTVTDTSSDSTTGQERKISLRITTEGVYFLVLMFSMLLIGINYSKPLIVVFTLFVSNVVWLSLWYSWRHVNGLQVFLLTEPDLFVTKTVPLVVGIHDNCNGFSRDRNLELRLAGEEHSDTVALHNGLGQWAILYAPTQRGELQLGPVEIGCHYPFAMFRATLTTLLPPQIVYPQPYKSAADVRSARQSQLDSEADMIELRRYQTGDMVSRIHWTMYQQNRELMVKTEQVSGLNDQSQNAIAETESGQEPEQYWVDWQDFGDTETERRLSQMTYTVLKASRDGVDFGLRLPGKEIPVSQGKPHRASCLRALAMYS